MIKTKSFTLQAPEKKIGGWAKFQQWNRKWNKIMSGVFSVLIFALLFAMVMVNTTSSNPENRNLLRKLDDSNTSCRFFPTDEILGFKCDVLCSHIQPEHLIAEVEAAIYNDNSSDCSSIGYHLRYDEPQASNIGPGWFKTNAIIAKVTIRDVGSTYAKVKEIEPGAFSDCTFRRMTSLVIRRTGVLVLRTGVFDGASSLRTLTMDENSSMRTFEEHTMDPLYQLNEMTMTKHSQLENLLNFTGITQLQHLRSLILSNNDFGTSITAETFKGCTNVAILNLSNSLIQTIGVGTFDHMVETLIFLDLSNNLLKHLPSDMLRSLSFAQSHLQIHLFNNSWHCDCEAIDLQLWSINNDVPLLCDIPLGSYIGDMDLSECDPYPTMPTDMSSVVTSYTTPATTVQTTPWPMVDRLDCTEDKIIQALYLEKVYQYFSVKQVEIGKVAVEMSSPDATLAMVVTNDKDEAQCQYDVSRQMFFNNLDETAVHLFCLIRKSSHATSPRNCFPFRFDDEKSIWSHDEIIIALVCSIVLSLLIGILCGWFLSYRYQRVFKAKEALQYQLSARSSSKTATEIVDFNSSVTSDYFAKRNSSYFGPNGTRLRRTYSDNSIISCKSYITAVTPSPFEIIQWKLRKNAMSCNDYQVRDYLDKLEYDCLPPPLPPHPNRDDSDKLYETIAEPVYMSTSEIVPYETTYASSV